MKITIIFILFSFFSFSQSNTLTGVIVDESNKPLEGANIIAKPSQSNLNIKFSIADNKGRYKLELDKNVIYEITVSYIGFIDEVFIVEPSSNVKTHDFKLKASGEILKEIVIKHDFKPLVVKKDTLIYDVKSFTNGNERKLKEQLEKLPGVEVDKNGGVKVQGKKVTKFLVEGDSFFGGGTKLGVENIPANAVDKVEVIDHFNEVGFMKQVSDSEDLAMNIKLKDDKKKFVFGDVEAGLEVANDNDFYLTHLGLFYYTPKVNLSYIGDINTIGKSTFSFDDLMRFEGGTSSYLSGRKSLSNLYSFVDDIKDVVFNNSKFSAVNYNFKATSRIDVLGYFLFSKILQSSQLDNKNTYLQNNSISFEDKFQNITNRSALGLGNLKLDYSVSNKEKFYYNIYFQLSDNDVNDVINSISNLNSSTFETISNSDNKSIKQYVEWHKKHNTNHTSTLVVNQAYEKSIPQINWLTDQLFLAGLIPLQNDATYKIEQFKKTENNNIDALFKHYWIINSYNHLYFNIGNNFGKSNFESLEKQIKTDGSINDFSLAGFGNNIKYQLNDSYIGIEYKFKIGKWTNKPGIYFHLVNFITEQINLNNSLNKIFFQPQFNSDYVFNKSETLSFNYRLVNNFPEASQFANQFTLQNYNLVFRGNSLLQNEKFHSAGLRYSKMSMYKGIFINANLNFNKKIKSIRSQTELIGINQFNTPILTNNPETNWRLFTSFSKKIYRFNMKLNSNLSWFNYTQIINNNATTNNRNNQSFELSLSTSYKKWPDFTIGYTKGFSQFYGITKTNYKKDAFNTNIEINLLKNFVFKFEYENLKNSDSNNQINFFEVANTSLRYQKKNSPLGFELFANNLFDNELRNDFAFSDYMISESSTYILPRIVMLSISYKL